MTSDLDAKRKRKTDARRKRYAEDPEFRERVNRHCQVFYEAHKTDITAANRLRNKNNPEKVKHQNLKRYGITFADYQAMLARQKGLCAICEKEEAKRSLCVDHCHDTGRVRRLLCNRCNTGLGNFDDDPRRVLTAAAYLLEFHDAQQLSDLRAWAAGSAAASALRAIFLPPAGQVRCEIIMSAETGSFRLQAGDAGMALQAHKPAKTRRGSRPSESTPC
jgi:hypothetical protein